LTLASLYERTKDAPGEHATNRIISGMLSDQRRAKKS
jgi:hypothetical protein